MSVENSNTAVESKSIEQRRQEAEAMAAMGMISMPGIAGLLIKQGEDHGVVQEICGQEAYDHAAADLLQARKEHEAAITAATEQGRKEGKAKAITVPKPINETTVEAVLDHLSSYVQQAYGEVIERMGGEDYEDLAAACGGEIPSTLPLLMATMRHRGGDRQGTLIASKAKTFTKWRGEGVDLVIRLNADRVEKAKAKAAAKEAKAKAAAKEAKAAANLEEYRADVAAAQKAAAQKAAAKDGMLLPE